MHVQLKPSVARKAVEFTNRACVRQVYPGRFRRTCAWCAPFFLWHCWWLFIHSSTVHHLWTEQFFFFNSLLYIRRRELTGGHVSIFGNRCWCRRPGNVCSRFNRACVRADEWRLNVVRVAFEAFPDISPFCCILISTYLAPRGKRLWYNDYNSGSLIVWWTTLLSRESSRLQLVDYRCEDRKIVGELRGDIGAIR